MLDDGHGGLVEVVRRAAGRVGVDVVVVGHLLAVQLLGARQPGRSVAGAVDRRRLVRVLAVAQHVLALPGAAHPRREAGAVAGVGQHVAHPRRDRHVVRRGVHERLGGQALALLEREAAGGDGAQHVGIVPGAGDDGDRGVVLGGRAHHRGAADVDLLDALVGRGARLDGLGERVEVGDDQVERLDLEVGQLLHVALEATVGQDAGVHPRVQGLDAPVEALGEAGEVLDLGDRQAQALDQRGGAARGDQGDAGVVQPADELLEAGLVVHGDQGTPDRDTVLAHEHSCGLWKTAEGGHPGGRCPDMSLPGGHPPAPVVSPQPSGRRRPRLNCPDETPAAPGGPRRRSRRAPSPRPRRPASPARRS